MTANTTERLAAFPHSHWMDPMTNPTSRDDELIRRGDALKEIERLRFEVYARLVSAINAIPAAPAQVSDEMVERAFNKLDTNWRSLCPDPHGAFEEMRGAILAALSPSQYCVS